MSLSIDEVITKLEAWREHDFHADRQLADEVLLADGWQCEPDPTFEGGVRWFWGTNPQVSSSENTRPHPINDLNAAVGVVPFGGEWQVSVKSNGTAGAAVYLPRSGDMTLGTGRTATVALVIAALRARKEVLARRAQEKDHA